MRGLWGVDPRFAWGEKAPRKVGFRDEKKEEEEEHRGVVHTCSVCAARTCGDHGWENREKFFTFLA
jgi:hypothetical protein